MDTQQVQDQVDKSMAPSILGRSGKTPGRQYQKKLQRRPLLEQVLKPHQVRQQSDQ